MTATGLTSSLGKIENLPIVNVVYAYNSRNGSTNLLKSNNCVYLGDEMQDYLVNPSQLELIDIRMDVQPKRYESNDPLAQSVTFPDGTMIPVEYDDVLPIYQSGVL